jgi:hypothetical protein
MLKPRTLAFIGVVTTLAATGQSVTSNAKRYWNEQDAKTLREQMAFGVETTWNNHEPAKGTTPDTCADDAIFINTTGGWLIGCQAWAEMITRLHAPGGPFHDHTRRQEIEELRFIRPDVALAVFKTFDIKHAGVPATGEDTRGLVVFTKEDGHWKLVANQNVRISAEPVGNR